MEGKKLNDEANLEPTESPQPVEVISPKPDSSPAVARPRENARSSRLVSLDAFRGFTILLMLIVNNIALDSATPGQLTHAKWNAGVRIADLVFPWFLFCVGTAIPFAAASARRKGLSRKQYAIKALGRAAALVGLGCLIESSIYKTPMLSLGVLQLIGLAYLAGAMLYELPRTWRLGAAAILLTGYWAAIKFVPVPNVGAGIFEEQINLITHINRTYLAALHLNGLLSVITTTALVLLGTVIGDALRTREFSHTTKIILLETCGLIMIGLGLLWNISLPFNKPLWTPSYILFTGGTASAILGLFYLLIDTHGWRAWSFPLLVFGSNAIVAYVAPILVKVHALNEWSIAKRPLWDWYRQLWTSHTNPAFGGWMYTTSYVVVWWFVLWLLYKKKVFLRV